MKNSEERAQKACCVCSTAVSDADAYLSGDGPVCGACHKAATRTARERNAARDQDTGTLLGGIFAAAAGAGLFGTALFSPAAPIRLSLACVVVTIGGLIRVLLAPTRGAHTKLGKVLVVVGALLAAFGLVLLVVRFSDGFVIEQ